MSLYNTRSHFSFELTGIFLSQNSFECENFRMFLISEKHQNKQCNIFKMAHRGLVLIVAFAVLCISLPVEPSFICYCQSKSISNRTLMEETQLYILHKLNQDVVFICNGLNQDSLLYDGLSLKLNLSYLSREKVQTFNFTVVSNSFFTLTITKETLAIGGNEPIFDFPVRDGLIYYKKEKNNVPILKVKLVTLPTIFSALLPVNDTHFNSKSKDVLLMSSPCNKDISYEIEKSINLKGVSTMYIQFGGQQVVYSIPIATPINNNNNNTGVVEILDGVVMSNHIILNVGCHNLYKGKFQISSSSIIFEDMVWLGDNTSLSLYRTNHCPLVTSLNEFFEIMTSIHASGNQTLVTIYPAPFEKWNTVSIRTELFNASAVHALQYDYGRHQIIAMLLAAEESSTTYVQIIVLTLSGKFFCKPWNIPSTQNTSCELNVQSSSAFVSLKKELDVTKWSSNDGGCTWTKQLKLTDLDFANFQFITAHSLSLEPNFIQEGKYNIDNGYSMLWTNYGVLFLKRLTDISDFPFFLHKKFQRSSNPFTRLDAVLSKVQHNSRNQYIMKFLTNSNGTTVPASWANSKIVSFKESISCLIKNVNGTELGVKCRSFKNVSLANEIKLERFGWFNLDFYHSHSLCSNSYFVNSSFLHLETPVHIDVSYLIAEDLSGTFIHIPVRKITSNLLVLLENESSYFWDEVKHVCIYKDYQKFQESLLQGQEICPISLEITGVKEAERIIYMDVHDQLTINVLLSLGSYHPVHSELQRHPWLRIEFSDPDILSIRTKRNKTKRSEKMEIVLKQTWTHPTLNLLSISTTFYHSKCDFGHKTYQIVNTCPTDKKLVFEYPENIKQEQLFSYVKDSKGIIRVFDLPINYQPHSSKGGGIPHTKNVYNADPSLPMLHEKYLEEQTTPVLKQCKEMNNRSLCNCTQVMKTSPNVNQSDCIEKVFRLVYREKFVPKFYLQTNLTSIAFDQPLQLTELNSREDYTLIDSIFLDGNVEAISVHRNTSIDLKGSGLYHFKVDMINTNISFCNFQTEFLIYIDGTPLPYPVDDIVRASTAFFFGFILLTLFSYQYYKPMKMD